MRGGKQLRYDFTSIGLKEGVWAIRQELKVSETGILWPISCVAYLKQVAPSFYKDWLVTWCMGEEL